MQYREDPLRCRSAVVTRRRPITAGGRRYFVEALESRCLLSANLVTNGSFETPSLSPTGSQSYPTHSTNLVGWDVEGVTAQVVTTLGNMYTKGGFTFNAADAAVSVNLAGFVGAPDSVGQNITTVVGASYTVTFSVGNVVDPSGPYGTSSFVHLFINGTQALVAANFAGTGNTVNWKQFTYPFTATTTSTNLVFANYDSSSDNYCGLDAISVTADTAPQQVAFIQQPSDTAEGDTIAPPVTVAVEDASGTTLSSNTDSITLTLQGGTGTLGGTVTEAAVNGIATFSDLSISKTGNYMLSAADPAIATPVVSSSFKVVQGNLVFLQQPSDAMAGSAIQPPITVELDDGQGNVESSDNTTVVTLSPTGVNSANPITGNTATLVNGVATFDNLTLSMNGVYRLQATGASDDNPVTSNPFTIGGSNLSIQLTSKFANPKGKVASGDHVFYDLLITSKKTLQSDVITDTLPAGFAPINITDKGSFVPSTNTITWNTTDKLLSFDLVVPNAMTLNGLTKILSTATANATFTDTTTDTASASNTVPIGSSFVVDGTLHDVQFQYPNKLTIATRGLLAGVAVNLIDNTGAVVGTATTKSNGTFSVDAGKAGTYTLEFIALTNRYGSAGNTINKQNIYAGQSVTLPMSNTKPLKVGDLYLPMTFFTTSAEILNSLNNYTLNAFQGLSAQDIDIFQFNTTGAEGVLATLAGTHANPGPLMNIAALKIGAAGAIPDPWVGAMRMMAGLSTVNTRFKDIKGLADLTGKALAVMASATYSAYLGKATGIASSKYLKAVYGAPAEAAVLATKIAASNNKLKVAARVSAFVTLGTLLSPLLDQLVSHNIIKSSTKIGILAFTFNFGRYVSSLFNGKLIDDLGFEVVFNLIRITTDAFMLQFFTGVSLRTDLSFPYSSVANFLLNTNNSFGISANTMQHAIDTLVGNYLQYNPATDTQQVLSALDKYDGQEHKALAYFQSATSIFNGLGSFLRGNNGILNLQTSAAELAAMGNQGPLQLPTYQKALSNVLGGFSDAYQAVAKKTTVQLQADALTFTFATALSGLVEQSASAVFIPNIAANAVLFGNNTIVSPLLSTPVPSLVPASGPSAQPPVHPAQPAKVALPSDAAAYLADLAQLSSLVKAGDGNGVTNLDAQFAADDQALFNSDLVLLDNQAVALLPQLSTDRRRAVQQFDTALNAAITFTLIAQLQMDTWAGSPSTAAPKAVIKQIATAIAAVTTAVKQAAVVRGVVSGQTISATLEIDETNVPLELAAGTNGTFVVTVTNVGTLPSDPGTISFENSDGSLVVQGPAVQSLGSIAAGGSATFTWQAQAVIPPDPNFGPAFQILTTIDGQAGGIADQVSII